MRRALPLFCLVGAAGIWAWALLAPKEGDEPLPERFHGRFEIAAFEPPEGVPMRNPLPPGQSHHYTFRPDGSYLLSVTVSGGYEMLRREGVVSVDDRGVLYLRQISTNRREDGAPPERYRADWGKDEKGPFLSLRHLEQGYAYLLRPKPEESASADLPR